MPYFTIEVSQGLVQLDIQSHSLLLPPPLTIFLGAYPKKRSLFMKHLPITLIISLALSSCPFTLLSSESNPNNGIDWQKPMRTFTITTFISSLATQAASPFLGIYKASITYKITGKIGASLLNGTRLFTLSAASGYGLMLTSTYTHKITEDNFSYKSPPQ